MHNKFSLSKIRKALFVWHSQYELCVDGKNVTSRTRDIVKISVVRWDHKLSRQFYENTVKTSAFNWNEIFENAYALLYIYYEISFFLFLAFISASVKLCVFDNHREFNTKDYKSDLIYSVLFCFFRWPSGRAAHLLELWLIVYLRTYIVTWIWRRVCPHIINIVIYKKWYLTL